MRRATPPQEWRRRQSAGSSSKRFSQTDRTGGPWMRGLRKGICRRLLTLHPRFTFRQDALQHSDVRPHGFDILGAELIHLVEAREDGIERAFQRLHADQRITLKFN